MPDSKNVAVSALTISLGPDDYEEARLIEEVVRLHKASVRHAEQSLTFSRSSKATQPAEDTELKAVLKRLGYDPRSEPRPTRTRGRAKSSAIPTPLPQKGTELLNCLGEKYTVVGYLKYPRKIGEGFDCIVYEDAEKIMRVRNLTHLFTGTLAGNIPFVTWPDDPRGYKPEQPVPLSKRRSLSKRDLAENRRELDPDAGWKPSDGPRNRGGY